jgi:cysteine desulfurase
MDMTPHFPIYMDYGATTPVDPRVVDAMIPWLREHFGNPASRSHAWGWEAEEAVEKAREQVAALIGADPREIVWTSGATESNNLAIKGAAHFYKDARQAPHHGEDRAQGHAGHDARAGAPGLRGHLPRRAGRRPARPGRVQGRAAPDTILVSVMLVNNEIGVIQDIPPSARCAASAASSSTSTPRRPPARWPSTWPRCRST